MKKNVAGDGAPKIVTDAAILFNPYDTSGLILGQKMPKRLTKEKYLPKEKYVKDPPKESSSHFGEKERALVYDVFEKYQSLLRERQEWDSCDASANLWNRWLRFRRTEERRLVEATCIFN